MTAHVLISGQLFDAPEQRTSKAGKPFVMATIRAKEWYGSKLPKRPKRKCPGFF
jgi:hypothetical protein